jgi:hypothetical protein
MSLLTTLQHHTRRAYRALDGVLQPGVWVQRGEGVYDPATGEIVQPEPERFPVSVLIRTYPREEVDGVRILAGDRQLFVFQALPTDVPALTPQVPLGLPVVPTVRDEVEIGDPVCIWHLVSLEEDAGRLTWQAQARSEGEG